MNEDQSNCLDFIEKNVTLLIDKECDKRKILERMSEFKKRAKKNLPDSGFVIYLYLTLYIEAGFFKSADDLVGFITSKSFIRKDIYTSQREELIQIFYKFKESGTLKKFSPNEVLTLIAIRRAADKAEKSKIKIESEELNLIREQKKVEKEEIDHSRYLLEQERSELEALKNSLKIEIDEEKLPEFFEEQNKETEVIWWKRLGLVTNPFPAGNKGLDRVVQLSTESKKSGKFQGDELFHKLLVRTPIMNEFDVKLRTPDADFLDNTFVVIGGYGSGKSVFFEYLQRKALLANIFPFIVWVDAEDNVGESIKNLYRSILKCKTLSDKYLELFQTPLEETARDFSKEEILKVLANIKNSSHYVGFLVIIDGLHKLPELAKISLRVVGDLQNLLETLSSNDAPSTLLIAGDTEWNLELTVNKSLSGTISANNIIEIPETTPNVALEMFNKRFQYLSINPEKPSYKLASQHTDALQKKLRVRTASKLTFRDYIDELLPSLRKGDSQYIQAINPRYQKETMFKIYQFLENNHPDFFKKLTVLRDSHTKRPEVAVNLLKTLIGCYPFVKKDSDFFKNQMSYLALLRKYGFIQEGYDNKKDIGFAISRDITKFNNDLKKDFGFEFGEVLLEIFEKYFLNEKDADLNLEDPELTVTRQLDKLLASNPIVRKRIEEYLNVIIEGGDLVTKESLELEHIEDLLNTVKNYAFNLLKSLLSLVGLDVKRITDYESARGIILKSSFGWLFTKIESFDPLSRKIYHLEKVLNDFDEKQYYDLVSSYNRFAFDFISLLTKISRTDLVHLDSRNLTVKDLGVLFDLYLNFDRGEYKETAKLLVNHFENVCRQAIFDVLYVKYGPRYMKRLGDIVNNYIKSSRSSKTSGFVRRPPEENALFDCDRWHYGLILLDKHKHGKEIIQNKIFADVEEVSSNSQNWTQIFSHIFTVNRELLDEWIYSIDSFSIAVHHNYSNSTFEANLDRLRPTISSFIEILRDLNYGYIKLVESCFEITENQVESNSYVFSFLENKDLDHLYPIKVSNIRLDQLMANMERGSDVRIINFDDFGRDEKREQFVAVAKLIKERRCKVDIQNGFYLMRC